ncbi:hypothetical protein IKF76_01765 [Candidatus Saccharibacteria bacterium]|nr:hypothetical protein [Candidatus Saccharibacteria bacterium]
MIVLKNYDFYLCGYNVKDERLFPAIFRMSKWAGHGLCYEISALMMLILLNLGYNHAKLVHGRHRYGTHSWVEFPNFVVSYALDPICIEKIPYAIKRYQYHKAIGKPRITFSCGMRRFRSYPTARILAECIKNPETSYILKELRFFRPDFNIEGMTIEEGFKEYEPELDSDTGKVFKPFRHAHEVISQEILAEFINDSELMEPSKDLVNQAWRDTTDSDLRSLNDMLATRRKERKLLEGCGLSLQQKMNALY